MEPKVVEHKIRMRVDLVLLRKQDHVGGGLAEVALKTILDAIVKSDEMMKVGCVAYEPGAKIRLDAVGRHTKTKRPRAVRNKE